MIDMQFEQTHSRYSTREKSEQNKYELNTERHSNRDRYESLPNQNILLKSQKLESS